jgi:membrane protease YdiL (CAAX protease family)
MTTRQSNGRLVCFFTLTFAISWLLWLSPLLASNGWAQLPLFMNGLGMFAPFGPSLVAFWLTGRLRGRQGIRDLWKRGWSLDFDRKWLVPTVMLLPAQSLISVLVLRLLGQSVRWEYGTTAAAIVPTFVYVYVLNALAEEYGWRGYALGALQKRYGALVASLILGLMWGLWHLPLHFIDGTVQSGIPVYQFVLQQMVQAVFYTWLFNNAKGAVSPAILFHPTWTTDEGRWISFGVSLLFSAAVVLIWGPTNLSRSQSSGCEK